MGFAGIFRRQHVRPDDKSVVSEVARRTYRPSANTILRIATLLVFLETPLKAYADPGSGLLLWQVAGAFFLGMLYQVRKFFGRLRKKR